MKELPAITDAIAHVRRGELTPIDLVERCLHRIDEFDDQIRAWAMVDVAGARAEAESLTALAQRGEIVGPLHGIPIGIKDIIDVAGMPTKAGSPLRESARPAESDAPVVARLREAGAIVLGKTVTTEWACFDPPPTRNPWNLNRTPGGSSSGSAAAVAMGMCMAALGTQTGGSIIRPAAYCGVCGLKPTYASLPMEGIEPVSFHLDHVGPIARSAADLHAMHMAMSTSQEQGSLGASTPELLRLDAFFLKQASEGVRRIYELGLNSLGDGIQRSAAELPASFAAVHQHHWTIMAVDAAQVHREAFERSPEKFGPKVAALMDDGLTTSTLKYATALRHQHELRLEMLQAMGNSQLLIMPSTPTTAPGTDTTGDAKFNSPWSYCGLPAVTIPCALDSDGLPVGMQLVGLPNSESKLLAAAAWCEQQLPTLAYQQLPAIDRVGGHAN